jgi:RHS repeat-associated protein
LTAVFFRNNSNVVKKIFLYEYDYLDRRTAKILDDDGAGGTDPTEERFIYDGAHVVLILNGEGDVKNRVLFGPGVGQVLADEATGRGVLWLLTDNQGTVRDEVNNDGDVINHRQYNTFGQITDETAPTGTIFAFAGGLLDAETGQQYHWHRYYSVDVGYWLSEDPIGFAAGDTKLNRYVGNAPTNFIDTDGLIQRDAMIRGADPSSGSFAPHPTTNEWNEAYYTLLLKLLDTTFALRQVWLFPGGAERCNRWQSGAASVLLALGPGYIDNDLYTIDLVEFGFADSSKVPYSEHQALRVRLKTSIPRSYYQTLAPAIWDGRVPSSDWDGEWFFDNGTIRRWAGDTWLSAGLVPTKMSSFADDVADCPGGWYVRRVARLAPIDKPGWFPWYTIPLYLNKQRNAQPIRPSGPTSPPNAPPVVLPPDWYGWRFPISNAIAGCSILEENFGGSSKAEASAR